VVEIVYIGHNHFSIIRKDNVMSKDMDYDGLGLKIELYELGGPKGSY